MGILSTPLFASPTREMCQLRSFLELLKLQSQPSTLFISLKALIPSIEKFPAVIRITFHTFKN